MKEKTRLKLAARGMGPLVRPGRPGRGRRGVLAPDRGAGVSDGAGGRTLHEAEPVVREVGPLGECMEPPAGSVRQRVRLRPVVQEGLDVEAERLGMTREGLCRFVLEEVARKAVRDPLPAADDVEDAPAIPAAYVGDIGGEVDEASPAGADPAGGDGAAEVAGDPDPAPDPPVERALLPVGSRTAGDDVPVRPARCGVRRLGGFGWSARVGGAWAASLAFALLGVLSIYAAAASSRYEVAGTAGEGVYVVDRWRGAVWHCGVAARGRPPACEPAVFRRPSVGAR